MTEKEQQIAIAEACGWKQRPHIEVWYDGKGNNAVPKNGVIHETRKKLKLDTDAFLLPDYLNDLNAMREAEMTLDWKPDDEYCQAADYHDHLVFVCGRKTPTGNPFGYVCPICQEQIYDSQSIVHSDDGMCHDGCPKHDCYEWHLITATAAQRAEAFLRTLGKWKE